ncbi:MAG: class I SAM-dependent methyltransferase [Polyangiaceae bacterium]|nr:class I SAM-dependent methyltransferase [Polyangiaceae bacterium]
MGPIFAYFYDSFMRKTEETCLAPWRRELLSEVGGRVLEIGAGTGACLRHYPRAVTRLVVAEPDRWMRARLARGIAGGGGAICPSAIETSAASADALPFDDASFDAVVSMLVLCSVPNQALVLAEIRRVLIPGGRFVFLEHVASDDPKSFAWQRWLDPMWSCFASGCHITRRTLEAIRSAGFELEREEHANMQGSFSCLAPTVRGIAR